jgi:hypothetical protein
MSEESNSGKADGLNRDCVGCGKLTGVCIPITVCKDCRERISNYLEAQQHYENALMSTRNVNKLSSFHSGDDDIDFSLDTIADLIFDIEKKLEWIKNNLLNIQQVTKTEFDIKMKLVRKR